MTSARVEQRNLSEDEQIMWDELRTMKNQYYGPLFCGPWKWEDQNWRRVWIEYQKHWQKFEAAYYRHQGSNQLHFGFLVTLVHFVADLSLHMIREVSKHNRKFGKRP